MDLAHILLVEDEEHLLTMLRFNLESEGYRISTATDGKIALEMALSKTFNLIILDVMLPILDGVSVCEAIRDAGKDTPILFLSAKSTAMDRIEGLKKGGDDYLSKPFHLEELLLRVDKLIAKKNQKSTDEYVFAGGQLSMSSYTAVNQHGMKQTLSRKEAELMRMFLERPEQVISREEIQNMIWGEDLEMNPRTIDNMVMNLRKIYDTDETSYFQSVRGIGYRFSGEKQIE